VERFFDAFMASDVPQERCRLIVYADSDSAAMYEALERRALETDCAEVMLHCSAWAPPRDHARVAIRRKRHAAMRSASVGLIPKDAALLLLLEDDTLIPETGWAKLADALETYDWVSGWEVGRWSCPCPGIWRIGDGHAVTPEPGGGLEPVDATGLYFALTRPAAER